MSEKIKWVGTLSTTERNNIGLIQVRQNNVNSEVLGFNIVGGNGEPYDLKNRKVLFCTYFDKLAPVEQYAEVIENGKIIYTMNEHDMQKPVRINFAYFKIMDEKDNLVDTTQNFSYDIMPSIESKCMNAEPYIIRLEEVLDAFNSVRDEAMKEMQQIIIDFNEQVIKQQQDFEFWFESIRDIIESIDPGGILLNEIIDFRYSKMLDKHFPRIKDRADFWDEEFEQRGVNVKWFGAVLDGKFDNSDIIEYVQNKYPDKLIIIPTGKLGISRPIKVGTNTFIEGSGERTTEIVCLSNNNAFDLTRCYRSSISKLSISTLFPLESDAISAISGQGVWETIFSDLIINTFDNGLNFTNLFWMNTIKNVRINRCNRSIKGVGTVGNSIMNTFINVYSDRPNVGAIELSAVKNNTFIGCNFGGLSGTNDEETYVMRILSGCYSNTFINCNFEHHLVGESGMIILYSSSTATLMDCGFLNLVSKTEKSNLIVTRDSSRLSVINATDAISQKYTANAISQMNSSQVTVVSSTDFFGNIKTDGSSNLPIVINQDFLNKLASRQGNGKDVKSGNWILPNVKKSENIIITVTKSEVPVIAKVRQIGSYSSFEVVFYNLDGTINYDGVFDIFWQAFKS